jgi:hypothetical protein
VYCARAMCVARVVFANMILQLGPSVVSPASCSGVVGVQRRRRPQFLGSRHQRQIVAHRGYRRSTASHGLFSLYGLIQPIISRDHLIVTQTVANSLVYLSRGCPVVLLYYSVRQHFLTPQQSLFYFVFSSPKTCPILVKTSAS